MTRFDAAFTKTPQTIPFKSTQRSTNEDTPYGLKALQGECDAVAAAPEGTRNHRLNTAAVKLGARITGGELTEPTVRDNLQAAAQAAGLDNTEIVATINSGLRHGMANPKTKPPMERAPSSQPQPSSPSSTSSPSSPASSGPTAYSTPGTVDTATGVTGSGDSASTTPTGSTVVTADGASTPPTTTAVTAQPPTDLWEASLIDWPTLWADQTEEEWIHDPLLPARRLVALYSPPKVGKSLLLLDIAVGVSRGVAVFSSPATRPYRVLYVDFENDPRGDIRARLQSMQVGPDDLGNLYYLSFPTLAGLDTDEGGTQLMAAVHKYGCEVVIIDTVSRSVDGEENDNDTWLNFYRSTGLKMKQSGIAMIRLDHTGKDETKGQRGGSAKVGDVDAVWKLSRVGTGERFMLNCEASRMQIAEKSLAFERFENPLRHVVDAKGYGGIAKASEEDIIAFLDAQGYADDTGEPAAIKALRDAGLMGATGGQRLVRSALQKRSTRATFPGSTFRSTFEIE